MTSESKTPLQLEKMIADLAGFHEKNVMVFAVGKAGDFLASFIADHLLE